MILKILGIISATVIITTAILSATTKTVSINETATIQHTDPIAVNTLVQEKALNPGTYKVSRIVLKDKERVVEINGEIGSNMIDAANKLRKLDKDNKPVYILLNSPGGSVVDGAYLIGQMQSMKSPTYTVCMEVCASMAAIIHQYGTKRYALDHSILMFHPASGGVQGQINNVVARASFLQLYVNKFNNYIVSRSKLTHEEYDKRVAYEMWLDAEDSMRDGFVDSIVSLDVESTSPNPLESDKSHGLTKFFQTSY